MDYKENLKINALNYLRKGYKVIFTNGNKIPVVGSWAKYRTSQTEQEVKDMFSANKSKIEGLAVLCTDGMEVIDIDQKYSLDGQLCADFLSALTAKLGEDNFFYNITLQSTKSGGAHLIYKTDLQAGNQKLASRYTVEGEEGAKRVLLETRGKGGYICVYPTRGYKLDVINKDKGFAPKISDQWRNLFISVAKSFEETTENHKTKNVASTPTTVQGPNLSTIEQFNANHTPFELLESSGWTYSHTRGENEYLVRPGKQKKDGISAGYNTKLNLVYIFTTSSQFDADRAYNAFQVYSILNHNSNYKDAAQQLYRDGYGERMSKTKDSFKDKITAITQGVDQIEKTTSKNLMEQIRATRFDINKAPKFIEYNLTYTDATGDHYNIAAPGDVITICGLQKSRKTALGSCLVSSALSPSPTNVLGFEFENKGRKIVYLDTEQTAAEDYKVQTRIYQQAGVYRKEASGKYHNPENYEAYLIGEYTTVQRLAFTAWIMEQVDNLGLVYIDGIVDLCKNYNDLEESQALVGLIKRKAIQKNITVIVILHNARSTGDARGHLGTELLNKSKAVIQVTKDTEGGFSRVNFKDLREKEPNDFDFCHDSNGNLKLY